MRRPSLIRMLIWVFGCVFLFACAADPPVVKVRYEHPGPYDEEVTVYGDRSADFTAFAEDIDASFELCQPQLDRLRNALEETDWEEVERRPFSREDAYYLIEFEGREIEANRRVLLDVGAEPLVDRISGVMNAGYSHAEYGTGAVHPPYTPGVWNPVTFCMD